MIPGLRMGEGAIGRGGEGAKGRRGDTETRGRGERARHCEESRQRCDDVAILERRAPTDFQSLAMTVPGTWNIICGISFSPPSLHSVACQGHYRKAA